MQLAVVFNGNKLSGRLTKFFTGCTAYHVLWHDERQMWDMHLIRRRRTWPHYPADQMLDFEIPQVARAYLERRLETDEATYGWRDYLLFALRPLYHLFGRSTRNAGGEICSEMVNNDLWECGVPTPWPPDGPPPSPCDLYRWLSERRHVIAAPVFSSAMTTSEGGG